MDYNISFDYSNARFMVSDDNLKAMSKRVLDAKEAVPEQEMISWAG